MKILALALALASKLFTRLTRRQMEKRNLATEAFIIYKSIKRNASKSGRAARRSERLFVCSFSHWCEKQKPILSVFCQPLVGFSTKMFCANFHNYDACCTLPNCIDVRQWQRRWWNLNCKNLQIYCYCLCNSQKRFANGALRIVHAYAMCALCVTSAIEFIMNRHRRCQHRVFVVIVVDSVAAAVIKIDFHFTNVFALDFRWHFFLRLLVCGFFSSLTSCLKGKNLRVKLEYWMANKSTVCVLLIQLIFRMQAHILLFFSRVDQFNQSTFLKTIDTNWRKSKNKIARLKEAKYGSLSIWMKLHFRQSHSEQRAATRKREMEKKRENFYKKLKCLHGPINFHALLNSSTFECLLKKNWTIGQKKKKKKWSEMVWIGPGFVEMKKGEIKNGNRKPHFTCNGINADARKDQTSAKHIIRKSVGRAKKKTRRRNGLFMGRAPEIDSEIFNELLFLDQKRVQAN